MKSPFEGTMSNCNISRNDIPDDIAEMRHRFDEQGIVPPAFGWDVAITSALAELGKVKASGKVDGNTIKGLEWVLRELLKMSDLFVDIDTD